MSNIYLAIELDKTALILQNCCKLFNGKSINSMSFKAAGCEGIPL